MNWLTNFVRPKLQRVFQREQPQPENLWDQCPSCGQMLFRRELERAMHVCTNCGHHLRIGPKARLGIMFDAGEYQTIELPSVPVDPLKFRDKKRYGDRLKEAQGKSGEKDAIVVAHGRIGGQPAVAAVFDFGFMGGSMGIAVGEGFLAAARLAVLQGAALIAVPASGGARMQEGILSLMQMPRTVVAVAEVREAGLPYIVLMTDPTTGGVSASFAMLGDIAMSEPAAAIGFAGARVIKETIRETLPEDFQRAEYLLDHGMLDMVVHRHALHDTLARTLKLLMVPKPAAEVIAAAPAVEIPAPPTIRAPRRRPAAAKAEPKE